MMKSISEESDNKPTVTAYPMNDELVHQRATSVKLMKNSVTKDEE